MQLRSAALVISILIVTLPAPAIGSEMPFRPASARESSAQTKGTATKAPGTAGRPSVVGADDDDDDDAAVTLPLSKNTDAKVKLNSRDRDPFGSPPAAKRSATAPRIGPVVPEHTPSRTLMGRGPGRAVDKDVRFGLSLGFPGQ